jgi:hypothetical protein
VSVAYTNGSPGTSSRYWYESVELVRLNAGDEAAAVSSLSAQLKYRFLDLRGAEVAPLSLVSPFYSPELSLGELVVTSTGMYEVTADELPSAAQAFVASFAAPGFVGGQPIPLNLVAEVTGYERASVTNTSSGPVNVELSVGRADALAATVDSLPARAGMDCHDDVLLYRVVFGPSLGAPTSYEADGHGCGAAVLVKEGAGELSARQDVRCKLFDAVAAVLPSSASGTLHEDAGCNPPQKAHDGIVEGRLVRVGGPAPGPAVGLPGSVVLDNAVEGLAYPISTRGNGMFKVSMPPGRYTVTGSSPKVLSDDKQLPCSAESSVMVRAAKTTAGVVVTCSVK